MRNIEFQLNHLHSSIDTKVEIYRIAYNRFSNRCSKYKSPYLREIVDRDNAIKLTKRYLEIKELGDINANK